MAERITPARLDEIETYLGGAVITDASNSLKLVAEIRAAWGEAEAATRLLRDFAAEEGLGGTKKCVGGWNTGYICGYDDDGEPIRGFTDYCRYCAARALVGSENRNEADE